MFKIDDDVPPPTDVVVGRRGKYPWRQMEVGQSFFVPGMTANNIAGSVGRARDRLKRKFTVRTVTENGIRGVRVWRLE